MCQLVRCETGEILRPAEGQCGFLVFDIRITTLVRRSARQRQISLTFWLLSQFD